MVQFSKEQILIVRRANCKVMRLTFNHKDFVFKLSAPVNAKDYDIDLFLKRCDSWIKKQLEKERPKPEKKVFNPGDSISIMGKEYVLKFTQSPKKSFQILETEILITGASSAFQQILKVSLIDLIQKILYQRSFVFAQNLGKTINKITVKDTKSRWGSCSSKNNINFSWRLVFAPSPVIDYLCAHEVAHLIEMNHSTRFWSIVAALCPNYKEHRLWLKKNSSLLHSIDL